MTARAAVSVVVPTIGRPSLATLLDALAAGLAGGHERPTVVLVDDRSDATSPLLTTIPAPLDGHVRVVRGRARGPAAARNLGWRSTSTPWIAFLDDDVVPPPQWYAELRRDIAGADPDDAAVQGRVRVPLPPDRRPSDWERNVAGLEHARWITADLAVRRRALVEVGGFDERFPRAYREDADLALRLMDAGWRLRLGRRQVSHPVRRAPWHVSIAMQRGNADDPWMRHRHGRSWRSRAEAPPGRRRRHLVTVAAAAAGVVGLVAGRPRLAAAGLLAWSAGTGELAVARVRPGPRTGREVAAMVATSSVLPFAAIAWWVRGAVDVPARSRRPAAGAFPDAVLFDRDGTLVEDVPYNGDPELVRLRPGAADVVAGLRRSGTPVGLVTNQSGIGRGLLERGDVDAVNRQVASLLGGLDSIHVCAHVEGDLCPCRKPQPGLILAAARRLRAHPTRCVVIGDIGADVVAAERAGARGILVPTAATRGDEVAAASEVAPDLETAVAMALGRCDAPGPSMHVTPDVLTPLGVTG